MLPLFTYLAFHSFRNRLVRRVRRLRSPRYAIAIIFGVAYLYLTFFRSWGQSGLAGPSGAMVGSTARLVWMFLLAFTVGRWWVMGGDHGALAFSPAEVQFLFPAPLTRRQLIHFKLLRSQIVIFVSTLVWTVLLRRAGPGVSPWLRAISFWVLFSTLNLHKLGASLVRVSAAEHGASGVRRNVLPIAVVATAGSLLLWSLFPSLAALRHAAGVEQFFSIVGDALRAPLAAAVLSPFRLLIAPVFASDAHVWLRTIAPAAVLMLLHYFWVVRTDAAFEDAAIESSARRAALIAAHRNRRSAVPMPGRRVRSWRVPLRATGRPGTAIFWKNVIAMTRTIRLSMLIVIVVILAALFGTAFLASGGGAEGTPIVALLALGWAGASVIIGPGLVRNDLRQDLPKLDLLRTYPLRGSSIVAAELLSSTTMLTLVQYALLLIAGIAFLAGETPSARELLIAELVALGAVALPAVNALALSIQNGAALLYPDWVRLGGEPRGGVEAIGQNMLTTLVSLLLLVVGLLVPAAIGGGVGYLLYARLARGAILIGFALALANVLFEVFLLIGWLGRLFERTEPSTATTGA